MKSPGVITWVGALALWCGAAVMSFSGLNGLARTCHIAADISWLLPLVIDVGVAVAAWVWRRGINPDATRLAGRLTWSLLTLTIVGNGAHLGMESVHVTPPWYVAAAVGAIPAAVAGTVAHLLVLLGRSVELATDGINESTRPEVDAAGLEPIGQDKPADMPAPTPSVLPAPSQPEPVSVPQGSDILVSRTRELLPIGRVALAKALDISEHTARELLRQAKAGPQPPVIPSMGDAGVTANNGHRVMSDA